MTVPERESVTPAEARARAAVRALPRPTADPAFRARLEREFVAGTIAPRVVRVPWFREPWVRPAAWAAAATLVVVSALLVNRGPGWHLTRVRGDGIAIVDGRPIPLGHRDELARAIRSGARVRLPVGAELEAMSPGTLAIQFAPGTDAVIPAPPGRWFARRTAADVRAGELRITSGRRFSGARLTIQTPEARVEVAGSTLAVICEAHGTCVCVLDGSVRVGPIEDGMVEVDAGRRRYVFNDGRPPEFDVMRPDERVELGNFREQMRSSMGLRSG